MDQVEEQNLIRRRMQHGMITLGASGATSTTGSTPVSLDEDVTLPLAAVLIGVALCSAVLVYFLRIISTISSKRPPRHANMKTLVKKYESNHLHYGSFSEESKTTQGTFASPFNDDEESSLDADGPPIRTIIISYSNGLGL